MFELLSDKILENLSNYYLQVGTECYSEKVARKNSNKFYICRIDFIINC